MKRQSERHFWAAFALLFAGAFALRTLACGSELWLDEIFSYHDAAAASSLTEITKRALGRNSHSVTLLWMYLIGDTPRWWLYRLPSLLAGCFIIPLAAVPLRRQAGEGAALAATALFGGSFFMLTYASEARAYAGIMFHALLAFRLAEEQERRPSAALEWTLGACLIGGALWQPVFIFIWGAFILWALSARLPRLPALRMLALPLGAILAALILGYRVHSADAAPGPRLEVLWRFIKAGFALPGTPLAQAAVAVALGAAFMASFLQRPKFESKRIMMLRLMLCTVPIAGVLAAPTLSVFPRYFSPALPLIYLSILYGLLQAAASSGKLAPLGAWTLGLFVLASNAVADFAFLRDGRGHTLDALRWMADHSTPGEAVRWISDHPYRNGMLVRFYARYLPASRFEVVSHESMGTRPAPWAIIHQIEDDEYAAPPQEIAVEPHGYRFVRTFAKFGLSGFRWHLYALIPSVREPSQGGKRPVASSKFPDFSETPPTD